MGDRKAAQEVLLRCLGPDDSAAGAAIMPLVRTLTPDGWESLFHEAVRHEVAPLVYHRLQATLPASGFPAGPLRRFRAVYLQTAARNTRLFEELRITLEALKKAGIPAILLKGAYLAEAAYGDVALRAFADLDVLIRRADLKNAHAVFREMGFLPLEYHREVADDIQEWHYFHGSTRWTLDVHWDIISKSYPFAVDVGGLWENSRPKKISGADVLVLSPEDTLLHLCLSASIHNYAMGLKVLCDIRQFVAAAGADIDWTRVRRQALDWKTARGAYLTLRLARDILRADIPEDFLGALRPQGNAEIPYETAREVILKSRRPLSPEIPVLPTMSVFLGKRRRKDKLCLLLKKSFPTREFIAAQFPGSSRSIGVYFFYPLWIIILLRRNYPSIRDLFFRRLTCSASLVEEKKKWALADWLLSS